MLCMFNGMNPIMLPLQTTNDLPWETYKRLSNLADETYKQADELIPCSDDWYRQCGLAEGYRKAAIMVLDCC